MADDDNEGKSNKGGGSALKIILIVLITMFLVGGTVAGLFLGGVIGGKAAGEEGDEESEEESKPVGAAIYIPMDPAFVVNFAEGGKARFLQITLEVMTRSQEMQAHIQMHAPVIRNNLLLLFSSQTYDSVNTLEGKEALRERALETIQEILETETGDPGVEAVYFTSFVMQ